MRQKRLRLAIAYDFDGTLAHGNMQEHSFLPEIGMKPQKFWNEAEKQAKEHEADNVLTYMHLMVDHAHAVKVRIRRKDFIDHGKKVVLFKGVDSWFDRINRYATRKKIKIEHYIISSGIHEIIAGTAIANKFKKIYASSFWYDEYGVAKWPALAINFTTKTQYLFRINKGILDVCDNKKINEYVPMNERPIPFRNIIFIGDGETDIPCFSLVKNLGGHSIAVYKPNTRGAKEKAMQLVDEGRVNFIVPADYTKGSRVEVLIKAAIDKIASDYKLDSINK